MTKSSVVSLTITPSLKDILIIISPQYADDPSVLSSINDYTSAISDESWNPSVIEISESENNVHDIRDIILDKDPYATMLIGEDIYMMTAQTNGAVTSLVPYYSKSDYVLTSGNRVIVRQNTIDIPTSLIAPNHDDDYATKVNQICSALTKFSDRTDLRSIYGNRVTCLLDDRVDESEYNDSEYLHLLGDLNTYIKPLNLRSITDRDNIVSVTVAESSSNRGIVLNYDTFMAFTPYVAEHQVDSPILLVGNTYRTIGFNTVEQEDSPIDPPISTEPFFGHAIFGEDIRLVMNIPYDVTPKDNIDTLLLSHGYSIAESIKGCETTLTVIYGDITTRI